jgi:phosphatidylethanolamine-binding protein (PEBP) family uncharacterized protein
MGKAVRRKHRENAMRRLLTTLMGLLLVTQAGVSAIAHPWHRPVKKPTEHSTNPPVIDSTTEEEASLFPLLSPVQFSKVRSEGNGENAATMVDLPLLLALAEQRPDRGDSRKDSMPLIAKAFESFVKSQAIKTRLDERHFFVESNGIPAHQMMVGITAWQQQVPIPQKYFGDNAWQIPLHPVPAKKPQTTKNAFLRGAIALAVNGIPIFNPLNNRGDDAYLVGELDEFGGHCGRADDYHYHLAPVHLEKVVGKGQPIAYALDGYPIYGYEEPDGSPVVGLDAFNGHKDKNGNYHYHATKKYPYLNGGFFGEVVERDGQVDPQPRAEPLRPSLPPLRDAKITDFKETKPNSFLLTYDVKGKKGTVAYTLANDGSAKFVFTDTSGKATEETYQHRERRGGGGKKGGQQPPPRPGEDEAKKNRENPPRGDSKKPPRNDDRPPPPRRDEPTSATQPPSSRPKSNLPQLTVTSTSVDANGLLKIDCTCDGKGQSPAIAWKGAPKETKSFAISLWHTAPDQEKSYWLVYNIPADVTKLEQNSKNVGKLGLNDKRRAEYDPMCSKGPGVKTYHITVFAVSAEPKLDPNKANRAALLEAIKDITLAEGTFDFQYERK